MLSNIMKNKDRVIRKVWLHKATNQKIITIPKNSYIESGDFVEVIKVK